MPVANRMRVHLLLPALQQFAHCQAYGSAAPDLLHLESEDHAKPLRIVVVQGGMSSLHTPQHVTVR